MTGTPSISISHAGFHVFDMDRMVDFFTTVYGFQVTDRGHIEGRGEVTFLGADPRDHHQLVLYEGRTATDDVVHHNHVSFRVDSLDRLRKIHARLQAYPGVTRIGPVCHGNAWSVYAYDPEGNRTERSSTPRGTSPSRAAWRSTCRSTTTRSCASPRT